MPEAVPAQPDLGDTLNESGVLQAGQRSVDVAAGELAQRLLVELPSESGRELCHAEVDARRPQPCRQDLVDAGREHFAGTGGAGAAGQLLEEQGQAGSPLDDQAPLCRVQPALCQRGHQPRRLLLPERLQRDVDRRRRPGRLDPVPGGDQDHCPGDALGGQETEQLDCRRVGPVQVLGHGRGSASTPPCGPAR